MKESRQLLCYVFNSSSMGAPYLSIPVTLSSCFLGVFLFSFYIIFLSFFQSFILACFISYFIDFLFFYFFSMQSPCVWMHVALSFFLSVFFILVFPTFKLFFSSYFSIWVLYFWTNKAFSSFFLFIFQYVISMTLNIDFFLWSIFFFFIYVVPV